MCVGLDSKSQTKQTQKLRQKRPRLDEIQHVLLRLPQLPRSGGVRSGEVVRGLWSFLDRALQRLMSRVTECGSTRVLFLNLAHEHACQCASRRNVDLVRAGKVAETGCSERKVKLTGYCGAVIVFFFLQWINYIIINVEIPNMPRPLSGPAHRDNVATPPFWPGNPTGNKSSKGDLENLLKETYKVFQLWIPYANAAISLPLICVFVTYSVCCV